MQTINNQGTVSGEVQVGTRTCSPHQSYLKAAETAGKESSWQSAVTGGKGDVRGLVTQDSLEEVSWVTG